MKVFVRTRRASVRFDTRVLGVSIVIWLLGTLIICSFFPEVSLPFLNVGPFLNCYRSISILESTISEDGSTPTLRNVLDALPFDCKSGSRQRLKTAMDSLLLSLKSMNLAEASVFGASKANPLVTVVVPFFNSRETLNASVFSLIGQSYKNLEILLIDDGAKDHSSLIAKNLSMIDKRIRVTRCQSFRDSGVFVSKNYGTAFASGSYVTFQDPNAISHPDRIAAQVQHLESKKDVLYAAATYMRLNPNLLPLDNGGSVQRMSTDSAMIRRSVFDDIGYFDSVRYSAHDEFYLRLNKYYGQMDSEVVAVHDSRSNTQVPLYYLFDKPTSPRSFSGGYVRQERASAVQHQHYVDSFAEWHANAEKQRLYIDFPLRHRPFPAPLSHQIETVYQDQNVIGTMATCRRRLSTLTKTLGTLIHQVDLLYVYLNDFKQSEIPKEAHYDNVVFLEAPVGDIKDNGKIFPLDLQSVHDSIDKQRLRDAYILTVDDDILYPADYVQKMILKIESQHRKAIFGVHCVRLRKTQAHYYDDARNTGRHNTPFWYEQIEDEIVHVLGSGTTAWHYTTFPNISLSYFAEIGMVDIWLAALAVDNYVPLTCVSRPVEWLKRLMTHITIYDDHFKDHKPDTSQTRVLKRIYPGYFEQWKDEK